MVGVAEDAEAVLIVTSPGGRDLQASVEHRLRRRALDLELDVVAFAQRHVPRVDVERKPQQPGEDIALAGVQRLSRKRDGLAVQLVEHRVEVPLRDRFRLLRPACRPGDHLAVALARLAVRIAAPEHLTGDEPLHLPAERLVEGPEDVGRRAAGLVVGLSEAAPDERGHDRRRRGILAQDEGRQHEPVGDRPERLGGDDVPTLRVAR